MAEADTPTARSAPAQRLRLACFRPRTDEADAAQQGRRVAAQRVMHCVMSGQPMLDLENLDLSDAPPGLDVLTNLTALRLSFNPRLKRLPPAIAAMQDLRRLNAMEIGLEQWPRELEQLPRLTMLNLSLNPLVGGIPDSIGLCPALQTLVLRDCKLDELPDGLADLALLRHLDVYGNPSLEQIPDRLALERIELISEGTRIGVTNRLMSGATFEADELRELQDRAVGVKRQWHGVRQAFAQQPDRQARFEAWLQEEQLRPSGTAGDEATANGARVGFAAAGALVRQWAATRTPVSLDHLLTLNKAVGVGSQDADTTHGILRTVPIGAGDGGDDDRIDAPAGRAFRRLYASADTVPAQVRGFLHWLNREELLLRKSDVLGQVALSAEAYQRLVSIHPFEDGNGRTTRLVMDWLLQSHGLPPLAIESPNFQALIAPALFADQPNDRVSTVEVIEQAMESLEAVVDAAQQIADGLTPSERSP